MKKFLVVIMLTLFIVSPKVFSEDSKKAKIILIGIDGLSENLIMPYKNQGIIPNISKLMKDGGYGDLDSFWPLRTMQVWTSVATGKLPGQHGIWDHGKHTPMNPSEIRTKKKEYFYSYDRKSQAIWKLLDKQGIPAIFVGWTTTWPAEESEHGIMVAPKVLYGDDRRTTIKGSFWKHVKDAVKPVQYESLVRQNITEATDISDEDLKELALVPSAGSPLYELPKIKNYVYTLRWSLARSRSGEAITLALFNKKPADVVSVYFQATDSFLHRFWIFQKSEEEIKKRLKQFNIPGKHAAALKKHFGQVVANCYKEVDARIGRLLQTMSGPNTLVLLVSDHGFGDGPKKHPFSAEPYGGIHWSKAMIIAAGPSIKKGTIIKEASVLDITPTLLHYLKLPVAKDFQGKIIKSLFTASAQWQWPVKYIESYEKVPQHDVPYKREHITPKTFPW